MPVMFSSLEGGKTRRKERKIETDKNKNKCDHELASVSIVLWPSLFVLSPLVVGLLKRIHMMYDWAVHVKFAFVSCETAHRSLEAPLKHSD
jgi:hypothetical protein